MKSANDDSFVSALVEVQHVVLLGGANRVLRAEEEDKDDELWQGDALNMADPSAPAIPVFVRIGQAKALVAELVCCCLAHQLGLPAPQVFVVRIAPGILGHSDLANANSETVCIGTRDLGGETFHQLLNANSASAMALLRSWPHLAKVVAFDGWTANIDRNLGNIIYAHESLCIIDHAEAFGGCLESKVPLGKLVGLALPNKLCKLLPGNTSARTELLQQLQTWLGDEVSALDVAATFKRAGTRNWQTPARDRVLVDFLRKRLLNTHAMLCDQLGLPQLKLTS